MNREHRNLQETPTFRATNLAGTVQCYGGGLSGVAVSRIGVRGVRADVASAFAIHLLAMRLPEARAEFY